MNVVMQEYINNVKTWATVPLIIDKGADWYAEIGTEKFAIQYDLQFDVETNRLLSAATLKYLKTSVCLRYN